MEQSAFQTAGKSALPPLPNSTAVLTLGIVSVVACGCFGLAGLAAGIIALSLAGKSNREYFDRPGKYSESSYKNMKAGKVCAIIGTCLNALIIVWYLFYMLVAGTILSFVIPWDEIFSFLKPTVH
jgi:hypothetical protein